MAVAVPRQQVASFAMQISKANVRPAAMLPLIRHFSQTSRVAQDEKAAVEEAIESAERTGSTADESSTATSQGPDMSKTIFVSNMAYDVTDAHISEAFGKFGSIVQINIARDNRGLSRGYVNGNFCLIFAPEQSGTYNYSLFRVETFFLYEPIR